jgi:hypothetical protein
MGAPTKVLQKLYFQSKDATIQDFKFEILICFNLSIMELWTT